MQDKDLKDTVVIWATAFKYNVYSNTDYKNVSKRVKISPTSVLYAI